MTMERVRGGRDPQRAQRGGVPAEGPGTSLRKGNVYRVSLPLTPPPLFSQMSRGERESVCAVSQHHKEQAEGKHHTECVQVLVCVCVKSCAKCVKKAAGFRTNI